MRKTLLIFLFASIIAPNGHAQSLEAFYSRALFLHPTDGPFIESYLAINGNSVAYLPNEDGDLQAKVEVTTMYLQNDSVKFYDKYEVRSPILAKGSNSRGNFMDAQRVALSNGVYQLEMQIKDLNGDSNATAFTYNDVIVLNFPSDSVSLSDIELVESFVRTEEKNNFVKGGVKLVPYTSTFYPGNIKTMIFYAEIYNTAKVLGEETSFLISYYIESQDSDQQLGQYSKFKKEITKEVNVLFNQFPIESLPSGNYNLVIEVKDRTNKILASKKLFFQRSNPGLPIKDQNLAAVDLKRSFVMSMSKDSLFECIRCLGPVSNSSEKQYAETQVSVADEELMRRYFQHFWEKRSPLEPESLWVVYSAQVKKVQREYGGMMLKGYETDRGRVYLQYGQPNSVEVRHMDPGSYPYEIWHYYRVGTLSNAKFIFYDPELTYQYFDLLHSNVPGEVSDPAWHYKLQNFRPSNVDQLFKSNSFDSRANELFDFPK